MIAILDANVLYPAPLRDFLMHLANVKLYQPKWSAQIQEEWVRNLLIKRPDLNMNGIKRTVDLMNEIFPDANVNGFGNLIDGLDLPDPDDRHVLAAAIKSKSKFIITHNLKDFPNTVLKDFNITILHPDDFVLELIENNDVLVIEAFMNQVKKLKNPSRKVPEVLDTLYNQGLKKTVEQIKVKLKIFD
ncbi:PIN domain-containing protein [Solitalea canadensis]|uniref:Uncharacterized protein n=1 Tax=Solitalea canadensis (strain ATCC 29591 / DSM 3403 / JCM 21819 / LMG 8368 / NBRC 15130 / NCIMB 12057 / USAM 9D) TaxID=929556 RepID=H8KU84_SOLCM|nr:PIN domain-containing protein [Solitalea canadensis]AFD07196.1 hypothetical protein Solca_2143 [Solitalea canadensis DSM 3403]